MRVCRTGTGFTLIELLVVIAVIALLAAILFPGFAHAREKARQAACLSNLQQIGKAVMMYVQDYDETFPGGPEGDARMMQPLWDLWVPGPEGSWEKMPTVTPYGDVAPFSIARRLLPYVKSPQLFFCPNNRTGTAPFRRDDTRFTRLSYKWHAGLSWGSSWPRFPITQRPLGPPLRLAEVARPALLQMAMDSFYDVHSTLKLDFSDPKWTNARPAEQWWNICYADGHAKFTRYVDFWLSPDQQPWYWNYRNPRQPVNIERPCKPSCASEARQN